MEGQFRQNRSWAPSHGARGGEGWQRSPRYGEGRGIAEPDRDRFAAGPPGVTVEGVVPDRQVRAVVARLGQVCAVVQSVLFGAGEHMVEPADAHVDVGVDEIALGGHEKAHDEHGVPGESDQRQSQLNGSLRENDIEDMIDAIIGDIDLFRHMVHSVQPPQYRIGMAEPVHQVTGKRTGQQCRRYFCPEIEIRSTRRHLGDNDGDQVLCECTGYHRQHEIDPVPVPFTGIGMPGPAVRNQSFEHGEIGNDTEQEERAHTVGVPVETQCRRSHRNRARQQERVRRHTQGCARGHRGTFPSGPTGIHLRITAGQRFTIFHSQHLYERNRHSGVHWPGKRH